MRAPHQTPFPYTRTYHEQNDAKIVSELAERAMKELENVDRETRPTGNEVGLIWKPENTTTQVATNWKPIDLISLLEIKIYWNL